MISAFTSCCARRSRNSVKSRLGGSLTPLLAFHSCRRSAISATRSSGENADQYSRSAAASSSNDAHRRSHTVMRRFYALLPPPEIHAGFLVVGREVLLQIFVDERRADAVRDAVDARVVAGLGRHEGETDARVLFDAADDVALPLRRFVERHFDLPHRAIAIEQKV